MALDKDQKTNLQEATRLLSLLHEKQREVGKNDTGAYWEGKPPLPILDEDDRGLLRNLSEKTFDLVKRDYPQLWQEVKEAFRADKIKEFAMGKEL